MTPPSVAEISKGRGNWWDFKNLDALSANGAYSPSKMGEIRVNLARDQLAPRIGKMPFEKRNLGGAA